MSSTNFNFHITTGHDSTKLSANVKQESLSKNYINWTECISSKNQEQAKNAHSHPCTRHSTRSPSQSNQSRERNEKYLNHKGRSKIVSTVLYIENLEHH